MNDSALTETQPFVSHPTAPLEAISAATHKLRNEWGDYGYSMSIEGSGAGRYLFGCRHSDGSEFYLLSDRYGNVEQVEMRNGIWTPLSS